MRAQLRKLVWASGVTVIEVKESDREATCATAASNAIVVTVQSHGAGKAAGGRNGKVHRLGFSNGASHLLASSSYHIDLGRVAGLLLVLVQLRRHSEVSHCHGVNELGISEAWL